VPLNKAQVVGKAAMSYSVENSKIKGCNLMVFFLFTAFIGCRKESLQPVASGGIWNITGRLVAIKERRVVR
jgi:hypothetical protein